jgi:hypothetical protein
MLIRLSTAVAEDVLSRGKGDPLPSRGDDTNVYTTFLPIILNSWCSYQSTRPPLRDTGNFAGEADILAPLHCTIGFPAATRIMVTGTYTSTPPDATLWVLVYPPNCLYYAQSPNACKGKPPIQEDGAWQVPTYLGLRGGEPEWFDIVVILADEEASHFLGEQLKEGCRVGQYTGIPAARLEQFAITEKAYISVKTLD